VSENGVMPRRASAVQGYRVLMVIQSTGPPPSLPRSRSVGGRRRARRLTSRPSLPESAHQSTWSRVKARRLVSVSVQRTQFTIL
jgi:hypothetical protein